MNEVGKKIIQYVRCKGKLNLRKRENEMKYKFLLGRSRLKAMGIKEMTGIQVLVTLYSLMKLMNTGFSLKPGWRGTRMTLKGCHGKVDLLIRSLELIDAKVKIPIRNKEKYI